MKLQEWLKQNDFKSWKEAQESGQIHVEKTERDMKLWFLEDMSIGEILDILERVSNTNYGSWEHIEDIDKWVFIYQ
ncbi:hypothetical protein [uncultured Fusobacterium sp.]|uniref:hypothetical protein n=1 Tax=uncultured Fusobacterium sp. TaxID=159267 RepID=UPI0015A72DFB|nr:hypothetical protein [uncultured Fusobacterium sp.]